MPRAAGSAAATFATAEADTTEVDTAEVDTTAPGQRQPDQHRVSPTPYPAAAVPGADARDAGPTEVVRATGRRDAPADGRDAAGGAPPAADPVPHGTPDRSGTPRPGDSEFGGRWFATKHSAMAPSTTAEAAAPAQPTRPAGEAASDAAHGPSTPTGAGAPAELPTRRRRRDEGADRATPPHVVIDLDLDGLLGLTIKAEAPATDVPVPDVTTVADAAAAPSPPAADQPALRQGPARRPDAVPGNACRPTAGAAETMPSGAGRPSTEVDGPARAPQDVAEGVPPGPALVGEVLPPDGETAEPAAEQRGLCAADLEAIRWRLDGATLREVVDDQDALRELGERLDEPLATETDNVAKAGLLSVRAEIYRLLGQLGMAAAASRLALAHAESAGDVQATVIAQAELAHVLRLRGDFAEADQLFARAAGTPVAEVLRSVVHENAGRCCFDQGRYMEALDHFARAIRLGRPDDTDLAARVGVCLDSVYIRVLRDGWGPYPRRNLDWSAGPAATTWDGPTLEQPVLRPAAVPAHTRPASG